MKNKRRLIGRLRAGFKPVIANLFLVIAVFNLVGTQLPLIAWAEPLPKSEIKALNQYKNWIADACAEQEAAAANGAGANVDALSGDSVPQQLFNFFVSHGYSPTQAAGILGNLAHEGVFDPENIQDVPGLPGRSKNPADAGKYGYGIAAWTPGTSLLEILKAANITDPPYTVLAQAKAIVAELEGKVPAYVPAQVGKDIKNATTVEDATAAFQGNSKVGGPYIGFERPADERGTLAARTASAQEFLRKFGNSAPAATPAAPAAQDGGSCQCVGGIANVIDLAGGTNAEKAFNYFIGQGLPPAAAAGIVGNMMTESGGNTEDLDTHAHNDISGTHDGIVQWSTSRWAALKSHEKGKDPYDLATQLDYVWYELKGDYASVLNDLKHASSAADAATTFNSDYEVSGDTAGNRETNARKIAAKYGGGAGGGGGGGEEVSAPPGCAGAAANGDAFVLGDYAWPVDITKSEVFSGYPWPCPGNCHHDNTPAFDLSTEKAYGGKDADVVGRAEFAISDGTIENLHIYNGISGCYSFHVKSSTDGYDYYYTHARRPAVREGQKVKAGDKVAEVGERKCTGNGSYPHLHIDRGSPKGAGGGNECCRDAGLVPILNKLYENLKG